MSKRALINRIASMNRATDQLVSEVRSNLRHRRIGFWRGQLRQSIRNLGQHADRLRSMIDRAGLRGDTDVERPYYALLTKLTALESELDVEREADPMRGGRAKRHRRARVRSGLLATRDLRRRTGNARRSERSRRVARLRRAVRATRPFVARALLPALRRRGRPPSSLRAVILSFERALVRALVALVGRSAVIRRASRLAANATQRPLSPNVARMLVRAALVAALTEAAGQAGLLTRAEIERAADALMQAMGAAGLVSPLAELAVAVVAALVVSTRATREAEAVMLVEADDPALEMALT